LRLTKSKVHISIVLVALILTISFSGLTSIGSAQPAGKVPVIIGFRNFQDDKSVGDQGGEIKYSYGYIRAIAASVPPQAIDALQRNPNVAYVETDFKVYALQQPIPWGIAKIRAPEVWVTGNKGTGIKVAIVDTGIDTTHLDLKVVGGATFVVGTTSYNDDNGHGTHCAGIVAALDNDIGVVGVAPGAALYAVKVLDSSGSGYLSDVIKGIEWCITNKMQVVSMSFGSTSDSTSLHAECDKAYSANIVLVAAAGNSGPGANTIGYPAKYSSVIAVGATDSSDVVASWSSRGPELSVTAPGVSIYSTYKRGVYATMSGTSMACPHVAGTVALILAKAIHTPTEVRNILQTTAVDLGTKGWDSAYGYGRTDAYAAIAPATPDFSVSISPSSVIVPTTGGTASYAVAITRTGGFTSPVTLSVSGLPSEASGSFSPTTGNLATLTVTVSPTETAGSYVFTVTGTGESLTRTATATLVIQKPDFSISASPSALTIKAGASGSSTIKVTSLNGFSGTVSLAAASVPTGLGATLTPTSVVFTSGGSLTSTLKVTVPLGTKAGTYTITVTGKSGLLSHTATVTIKVTSNGQGQH